MPELPEVETLRRQLAPVLEGRHFLAGWGFASPKFEQAPRVAGARIGGVSRRGKYLLVGLDGAGGRRQLVVHLGMSGSLTVDRRPRRDPHLRAWWQLDDDSYVHLRDPRRFGRVAVVAAGHYETLPTLHTMGPEPLSEAFTAAGLHRDLRASRVAVKTQLLNQRVVAGLGNIYADEALWAACINPATHRVGVERAELLHRALREVLHDALARSGTTLRDYRQLSGIDGTNQFHLRCYGRAGLPCLRCGTLLRTRVLGGRTTTWCPHCQRR